MRKRGPFRPGNRRRRWRQAHGLTATLWTVLSITYAVESEGNFGALLIAAAFGAVAAHDIHAYRHGWKISYDLSPWGREQIKMPGLRGDIARRAWARTQDTAKDPNRPRYAFDRPRSRPAP